MSNGKTRVRDVLMDGLALMHEAKGVQTAYLAMVDQIIAADLKDDPFLKEVDDCISTVMESQDPGVRNGALLKAQRAIRAAMSIDFGDTTAQALRASIIPHQEAIEKAIARGKVLIGELEPGRKRRTPKKKQTGIYPQTGE